MDATPGKHRSEMDQEELQASLHYGNPFAATASMLWRDEELRQIARPSVDRYPGKRKGAL